MALSRGGKGWVGVAAVASGVALVPYGHSLLWGRTILRAHHVVALTVVGLRHMAGGSWVNAKQKNVNYRWSSWDVVGNHYILGVAIMAAGIGLVIAGILWLEWEFGAANPVVEPGDDSQGDVA